MNDKIVELSEQAHLSWVIQTDVNKDSIEQFAELTEQFAELIIKECIGDFEEKIKIRYAGDQKSVDVGYGMELVIDSIKQKFGML